MFLLGTLLSANAQVPSYVPKDSLKGWWPFTGNANDVSGNGYNGTVNGGATLANDRFSNSNSAYSLDGVNDYVEINNNILSQINGKNALSISYWFNTTSNGYGAIWGHGANNYAQVGVNTGLGSGYYNGVINGGNYTGCCAFYSKIVSPFSTWHHAVIVFDANQPNSSKIKIYIDGLLNTNFIGTPNNTTGTGTSLFFGRRNTDNNTFGDYFGGLLDDFGVWSRTLTQQEITNLYNGNICYKSISVTDTLIINVKRTSLNPLAYTNTIKVYPNPTKDKITIDNGDLTKMTGYSIKIYNSIGQQLFQSNITQQQFSLDITQWGGNGLYFMELKDNNGNIVDIKKIVLQ